MSDDDHTDRTLMEAGRLAIKGKIGERGADRRTADRLTLKDWVAYIMIVAGPVATALWTTHQSVTRLEVKVEQLEESKRAMWDRLGNHIEGHGQ